MLKVVFLNTSWYYRIKRIVYIYILFVEIVHIFFVVMYNIM